jgi:RNA polymerase sigma-70 factor (ECF subfamily)
MPAPDYTTFRQIPGAAALLGEKETIPAIRMEDASDHDSWKIWFHNYGPRLLVYARQCTRTLADAEDVVQEAFVRYWRHQRKLGGAEPLPLMFTSVRRAAIDLARREGRRAVREARAGGGLDETCAVFEPSGDGEDRRVAIEAALRRLPPEQREVLALKIWGGLTFEDIGGQLGVPPNTAASRYRYALDALRRELRPVNCNG